MKKRFVSLLLAISMILSLMPVSAVTAFAEGENNGAAKIIAEGNCGVETENNGKNLSWTLDNNGVLTISGNGAMKNYWFSDYYRPGWYRYKKDEITSVVFSGNITHIGDWAFDQCENIQNVTYKDYDGAAGVGVALPKSVITIGDHAFSRTGVTGTLKLPENLTTIGAYAFYQCTNLTGPLVIPQGIKSIEEKTFAECGFTGDITIPDDMTTIGDHAFDKCTNINSVRYTDYHGDAGIALPESVTTIGKYAFSDTGVTGPLELPKNLPAIGSHAFYQCRKLNGKLTIPKNITEIDEAVFERCGFTGDLVIPDNVTKIGSCAFQSTYNNTGKLILPDGLTEIGFEAFYDSHFQGDLTIPNSVTTLAQRAFEEGSFSGKLTLSNSLQTLNLWTFYNCRGFYGDLVIPASVTTIGKGVFDGSYYGNITGEKGRLIFADGSQLTEIGEGAFQECPNLTGELKLPNTVETIGSLAFKGNGFTGELKLPANLKELGESAFENCSGLTGRITFPSNMSTIHSTVFCRTRITEVVIPSSIGSVWVDAFYYCNSLKKVYLPAEIPTIYDRSFRGCSNVKFYYPGYKAEWDKQTQTDKLKCTFDSDMDAVKPLDVGTLRPICYYVDVTFDAGSGEFQNGEQQQHIVKGDENELYRTENLTEAMVTAIGTPKQSGYHFAGWSLKPNGSVGDVLQVDENGYMTIADNGMNEFGGVEDGMTLYAVYTSAASVKINGFAADGEEATTIKAGKEHEFTLIGDENTDRGATVTLALNDNDSTNAKLEYYNSTTEKWQEVTDALNVSAVNGMSFRVAVPKNAGDATVTLTAVVKDVSGNVIEDGGDSKTFKVNKYVNAEVTITDLDGTTVKAGEAKDFTVNVTPNDDTIDKVTFVTTSGEVQWSDDSGNTWTTVSGDVAYSDLTGKQFRVVPAADAANGTVTVTVTAKKADGTEIAKTATFTVTAREHATVAINNLNGETIKQNKAHTFTVTVTAHDDSGNATLTFDNVAGLTYNGTAVTNAGVTVALTKNQSETLNFTLTPSETGSKSLKAALSNGAANTADYTVSEYVNAEVKIDGLSGTVETDTEKEFTVTVTANDDADQSVTAKAGFTGPAGATITLKKVQYRFGDSGEWQDGMQELNGMNLDINSLKLPFNYLPNITYKLTVTFAEAGNYKFDVSLTKKDAAEAFTSDSAEVTVTKKEEPVTPGGGSTGGGENPGENPGGNPGSGSTTPKHKLEIADGTLTSVTVKDENGNLKDITDTITKDLDGKYEIPVGAKVTVTAKDAPEGMKFGEWSISDKTLLSDPDVPYTEKDLIFTMPDNSDGVKLSVVYLEESIGEEPNLLEKGALAGTVVVGSAALLYQGHMLGTELYLRYLLPHGAVIPQNRAELAVLLWQDAENPEPVSTTLYSDISDEDSAIQQAARWAVENDLMEQLDAEEHPDHFDPFVPVTFSDSIRAWKKAQELKKSVH